MAELKIEDHIFDVDIEKTREYYRTHSLCDCPACRNFYAQAASALPDTAAFLAKFGIDIAKPDETGWGDIDDDGKLDYIFAIYTADGRVIQNGSYEIDIDDAMPINIVLDSKGAPSDRKDGEHFAVTVFGIRLPWILDEELPGGQTARHRDKADKSGAFEGRFARLIARLFGRK